ncbi:hypothetical protein L6472_06165 [Prevotella sp. E13-17]|uniref:hypothetical protein n=1 Tax=Prevotella sp. E13-17 TaxID=2913616 RepID=UPI001EDA5504|nr:hypothetical protein [Prevotella sp. E13-17]UKK52163.1 hypothetical protein L6472_06165 [Prevotella sp. E13-17]
MEDVRANDSKTTTSFTTEEITLQAYLALVRENTERNRVIFEGFNPVTGKGCPGERKKVVIEDCPLRKMLMPVRCAEKNIELRKIIKRRSIRKYIELDLKTEYSDELFQDVVYMIFRIRSTEDPAFAFITFYKIQNKITGEMKPFSLNYPQRLVLDQLEGMRAEGLPIRLIILKARQWGGSTLSEGYEKWMQDFRHPNGWGMVILAHVKDATKRIKAMFTKMVQNQPGWSIADKNDKLKLGSYQDSKSDFIVKNNRDEELGFRLISVGSYEKYDSLRSADTKMAHYSEVAYWKKTAEKEPEEVLSSIDGGIPMEPDTVEIMESSGRSAAGFFPDMYRRAKDPALPSAWRAIFIAFFQIENDRKELDNKWPNIFGKGIPWRKVEEDAHYKELSIDFAKWLYDNKDNDNCPEGWQETGKFFWQLWLKGATFEAINWYRHRRNTFRSHTYIATEAPSDDVEAFRASGNLIFDMYAVEALRRHEKLGQKEPIAVGNIVGDYAKGLRAIKTAHFEPYVSDGQVLKIWQKPDCLKVSNRYIVSVDIGGAGKKSDFTVMTVIDRFQMMFGGKPKVVARWRGHIRHDLLAWKAAQLAHYYQDALLVFESNTAETEKGKMDTEGDHFGTIIDEIADSYRNLYIRETSVDSVTQKRVNKYGFQTNRQTKQYVIDNYIAYVDDQLYEEPDVQCYDEMTIYERHEDGSIGNVEGKDAAGNDAHDDIVMSTGIGLYISQTKMAAPAWIKEGDTNVYTMRAGTEADV